MTNEELIEAYFSAISLDLDQDFIEMLEEQMVLRGLKITDEVSSKSK